MLKISLICIGKLKSDWLAKGVDEFSQKISKLCAFELVELKEPSYGGKEVNSIISRESTELKKKLLPSAEKVYCDVSGSKLSSEGLADLMDSVALNGRSHIQFFIGGAYGVDQELLRLFDRRISFSPMTFNHQLFRLIALEQIYRACTIRSGHPYHHSFS